MIFDLLKDDNDIIIECEYKERYKKLATNNLLVLA